MADELATKRIINLPAESEPADGDVLVVDNESTGTKKIRITGIIDDTFTRKGMAASAKETGEWVKDATMLDGSRMGDMYSPWTSRKTILNTGKIGTSNTNSACSEFIQIPAYVTAVTVKCNGYSGVVGMYSDKTEESYINRLFIGATESVAVDITNTKYIRIAIGSLDISNTSTIEISYSFRLKTVVENLETGFNANETKTGKALTTDNSYANTIAAETDYNSITAPGNYYCSSSANAQSMIHCPVTVAHRMYVIATTAAARIVQLVIPNNNNVPWNYRYYDGSSWGEWLVLHTKNNSIQTDGITITADNYTEYFTDFNNAPLNSVFYVRKDLPIDNYPEGFMSVLNPGDTHGKPAGTLMTVKSGVISGLTTVMQLYATETGDPDGGSPNAYLCVRTGIIVSGAMLWSKWSRMGEALSVTSTNEGIPNSRILSGDAPFTDFDDAPINTIYQVDLNAVDMANNPMRGHSCVLITQAYSTITRHGIVQYCIGVDVVTKMYFRYGYLNQPTVMAWTDWQEVCTSPDDYMRNRGSLANNTDLNSITGNVIYILGASNTYANAPISGVALWLTAKKVGNLTSQTIERLNGDRCVRYTTDNGSTWGTWSEWK